MRNAVFLLPVCDAVVLAGYSGGSVGEFLAEEPVVEIVSGILVGCAEIEIRAFGEYIVYEIIEKG